MPSDRRKSMNRLSALLFSPITRSHDPLPLPAGKDRSSSSSPSRPVSAAAADPAKLAQTSDEVRKNAAKSAEMLSLANWPLAEEPRGYPERPSRLQKPQPNSGAPLDSPTRGFEMSLTALPLSESPEPSPVPPSDAQFTLSSHSVDRPYSRERAASISSPQNLLDRPPGLSAAKFSHGIGAHSAVDLSRPSNKLLKHQRSEVVMRQNTAPVQSIQQRSASAVHPAQTHGSLSTRERPPVPQIPKSATNLGFMPPIAPKKRKTWLLGRSSTKAKKKEIKPAAWITGTVGTAMQPYDLNPLTSGQKVPELWQENGNIVVYLCNAQSKRGPSFRLSSEHIASSSYLTALAHGKVYSMTSARQSQTSLAPNGPVQYDPRTGQVQARVPSTSSMGTSPNASHTDSSDDSREARGLADQDGAQVVPLYVPMQFKNPETPQLCEEDVQKMVNVRNLFSFLIGQSLIATPKQDTTFHVMCQIAKLLKEFGFSNMDSSTYGEVANASFDAYVEELGILDVRNNREKTLQGLILGEKMRSAALWNEAFVHAVGRWSDIQALNLEIRKLLSPVAVQRIERGHMELEKRIMRSTNLGDMEFPTVFAGITNSRMAPEREIAQFNQWKTAFMTTRKFVLTYLKSKNKAWPPKKPKSAGPSVPALNRKVLQAMYNDLVVVYDLLVDRKHPSSRLKALGRNLPPHPDARNEALRKVLGEFDNHGSPVYPPIPFDTPRLPRLSQDDDKIATEKSQKKLGKTELAHFLKASYNKDTHDEKHSFSTLWQSFEFRQTSGMSIDKVANFRLGAWLFIYVVLQSLPLLVVDAPNVKYTDGVDYFLCNPPRGRLHWSKEPGTNMEWFRDPVTGVAVQATQDSISFSDEAMFRLSHCWVKGALWEQELPIFNEIAEAAQERAMNYSPSLAPQSAHPTPPASEHPSQQRYSMVSSQGHYSHYGQHSAQGQYHPEQFYTQSEGYASPEPYPSQAPFQFSASPSPQSYAYDPYNNQAPIAPFRHGSFSRSGNSSPSPENFANGLEAPPVMPSAQDGLGPLVGQPRGSRNSSPHGGLNRRGNRESILMMGLERLPVPAVSSPMSREQRASRTASMTFDEILAPPPPVPGALDEHRRSRSGTRKLSKA